MKKQSGKSSNPPPTQPIKFNNKAHTKPYSIANKFNKQFTSISIHRHDPNTRKIIRKIHKTHKLDPEFRPFSPEDVQRAITRLKNSTATGPDEITALHLKRLGPCGISYLCNIYNNSVNSANIPALWKHAKIIPILKPNKPP